MSTHTNKTCKSKTQSQANEISSQKSINKGLFEFTDNRSETIGQRKIQAAADNHTSREKLTIQKKEKNTGLPEGLKTGIENISGYSMDNVKVHYNSDKPAQLNAHAYAKGSEIHLGPGQERHLPHEAWHVVQQKQGRVKPTIQTAGQKINNNTSLETEADIMGIKAVNKTCQPVQKQPFTNKTPTTLKTADPDINKRVSQLAVSGTIMNLWDREHNQEIALESGGEDTYVSTIDLKDGDIQVHISEHANNHFVNRHTYKEFSFKDENIKVLNSFWDEGTKQADVNSSAEKVIEGLEDPITKVITEDGGGAVFKDNDTVAGLTVGYNISLDADDDAYEMDEDNNITYTKGTGHMNMFYPEGDKYDYYSSDELEEIRERLQKPPYNKVLQLKKAQIQSEPGSGGVVQGVFQYSFHTGLSTDMGRTSQEIEDFFHESQRDCASVWSHDGVLVYTDQRNINQAESRPVTGPAYTMNYVDTSRFMDGSGRLFIAPQIFNYWQSMGYFFQRGQQRYQQFLDLMRYENSKKQGMKNVKFAEERSIEKLDEADINQHQLDLYLKKSGVQNLISRLANGHVTFNFDYGKAKNWKSPQMLNSFEVFEQSENKNVTGFLKDYADTRDEIENNLFGIGRASEKNPGISGMEKEEDRISAMNTVLPPNLRPKYAALNYVGYKKGAAPSEYYGKSHVKFNNAIKSRCTMTSGDSLGDTGEGARANLAFPLTQNGILNMIKYNFSVSNSLKTTWNPEHAGSPDDISTVAGNANNPDYNFIEVQIHGDVFYHKEASEIVIDKTELKGDSEFFARQFIVKLTGVNNISFV